MCAVAWHILQRCAFVQLTVDSLGVQPDSQSAAGAAAAAAAAEEPAAAGVTSAAETDSRWSGRLLGAVQGTSAGAAWVTDPADGKTGVLGAVTSCRVGMAPITKPEKTANPGAAAAAQGMSDGALEGLPSTVQVIGLAVSGEALIAVDVDLDEEPELVLGGPALCVCSRSRSKGLVMRLLQWPQASELHAAGKQGLKLRALGPSLPGPNAVHWRCLSGGIDQGPSFLGCLEYDTVLQFVLLTPGSDGGDKPLQAVGKVTISREDTVLDIAMQGALVLLRSSTTLVAVVLPLLVPLCSVEAPPAHLPASVQGLLSCPGDSSTREGMLGSAGVCMSLPLPDGATVFHTAFMEDGHQPGALQLAVHGGAQALPVSCLLAGLGRAARYLCEGMLPSALAEAHSRCSPQEQWELQDAAGRLGWHAWCCLLPCLSPEDAAQHAQTHLSGEAAQYFAQAWTAGALPSLLGFAGGDASDAELEGEDTLLAAWMQLHQGGERAVPGAT